MCNKRTCVTGSLMKLHQTFFVVHSEADLGLTAELLRYSSPGLLSLVSARQTSA